MNQESLHSKVVQMTKRNKKAINSLAEHLLELKRQSKEQENTQLNDYRKEYENLIKLCQESEEETQRLKRELVQIDIEIEELEIKNSLSKSRIKLKSQQIENIRDETHDIDKKRRREQRRERNNHEMKRQAQILQQEIRGLQNMLQQRSKNIIELQSKYQGLIEKKQNLNHTRKESHKRHKNKVDQLQQHLRQLKNEANALRIRKEKEQEKTKRNFSAATLSQIRGMLQKHRETHNY